MLTKRLLLLLVLFVCLAGALEVAAQDEDSSKAIKAEEFIKDRPGTTKKSSAARYKPAAKSPTTVAADTPPPGTTFAQLGVTFWRFRRSLVGDRTKELVEEEEGEGDWTLERIEEGTPL